MTPTDPQPTAPPTVAPASDEEISDTKERAKRVTAIGSVRALKLIARIEADRAENDRLRARVAELKEALSKVEKGIFDLTSDSPICQLHRLKLSGLVDFIRAALKPEPASR